MASFIFEEGNQTDATAFEAGNTLVFSEATPDQVNVVYTPASGLTAALVTLTFGTQELTFSADAIAGGNLVFDAGGELVIGTPGIDAALEVDSDDFVSAAWGLAGGDTITVEGDADHIAHGGAGADTIDATGGDDGNYTLFGDDGDDLIDGTGAQGSLTINGGAGEDTIEGGDIADRIYGNDFNTAAGTDDDGDEIDGNGGNDYIQGNAGEDDLDGGAGRDRVYGGADDDTIEGGSENDTVNGNKGDDTITDASGDDSLRGGQGNDTISAGTGRDFVGGDLGDDDITGGAGTDYLSGGEGDDTFNFAVGTAVTATLADDSVAYETISDFTAGDSIVFTGVATLDEDSTVLLQDEGVAFTSAEAAATYAAELFADDATANSVVAIQVGADTYLFYDDDFEVTTDDAVNSSIRLIGVTAEDLAFNEDGALVIA